MWWLANLASATTGPIPPPHRLRGGEVAIELVTATVGGPPFGGRVEVAAFERGWTYGFAAEAGLDPGPDAWFVDTLAAEGFVGRQFASVRHRDSRSVLTPFVGGVAYRWLPAAMTAWGPTVGLLGEWRYASHQPTPGFGSAGIRVGAEVRFLPTVLPDGSTALAPQPLLRVGLNTLFARRVKRR